MHGVYDLIRNSNVLSTLCLTYVVIVLGRQMVGDNSRLYRWGLFAGVATLLGCVGVAIFEEPPTDTGDWLVIVLRSLLAAGILIGSSWVLLPVIGIAYELLIQKPRERLRLRRLSRAERRRAQEQRAASEESARIERERQEQAALERAERQREEEVVARAAAIEKARRDRARSDAELCYWQHAVDLGSRFTRSNFENYLGKYMGDGQPADDVERRAEQLRAIITYHRDKSQPMKKTPSVESLVEWYVAEKNRIESLPLESEWKEEFLIDLQLRFSSLKQDLLREAQP